MPAWVAVGSLQIAVWLRRLLVAALRSHGLGRSALHTALTWHLPHGGITYGTLLVALLLVGTAGLVAHRGMGRIRRGMVFGGLVALVALVFLAVMAGVVSDGFGPWILRSSADRRSAGSCR